MALKFNDIARRHWNRAARFAGVGVVNTVADFGAFLALTGLGAPSLAANAAAFILANAQSYVLNARFTFREGGAPAPVSPVGFAKFAGSHLASLAISTAFIAAFSNALGPLGAKIVAGAFTLAWNYGASAFFVFRRNPAKIDAAGGPA